jgi:hypothetical protein
LPPVIPAKAGIHEEYKQPRFAAQTV